MEQNDKHYDILAINEYVDFLPLAVKHFHRWWGISQAAYQESMEASLIKGTIQIFNEENIEVITGANGLADEAVKAYIAGKLKTTGSVCHAHQHADDCDK